MPPKNKQPLSVTHPELALEWHPTKNGDLTPADVVEGSAKTVWWKCAEGPDHEWAAAIYNRTRGPKTGCPCCANHQVSVTNSLASLFPEISAEWHPKKNGELTPADVVAGSNKKFWWKCAKGPDHEWEAAISNRTGSRKTGCPCCANYQVSVTNSLASLFPEIANEWHPTKNGNLTPADVVAASNKKVWWKCPKGEDHEWETTLYRRTGRQKAGCPCCSGRQVSAGNSLATLFPKIAAEWHPTKNGALTPSDVVPGSNKKVWWKCPKGIDHEWETSVNHRATGSGTECPCCANYQISVTNSLASMFPEIAAEWHPTKNGALTPADVVPGSNAKIWWKCPKGEDHEWEATLSSRTGRQKTGCPCCHGVKVSVTNSLTSVFPEIAAEWHPSKNEDLTPADVVVASTRKVSWKCPKGPDHEWEMAICKRTGNRKSGCPFCSNRQVSVTNSLAFMFPDIAVEWHYSKNGDMTPADVVAGSTKKVWWKCPQRPDHEWEGDVAGRTQGGDSCPACKNRGTSPKVSLIDFSREIAAEWHPAKNGDLTPSNIAAGSHRKVWWKCQNGPDHEWEQSIGSRTGGDTFACPFCSNRRVSVTNSLASLFPEIAAQWHPTKNGDLTPADVVAGSTSKVWWQCPKEPDHEWEAPVSSRTGRQKNGCPCCSNRQVSVTNSLASLFPEIAAEWHSTKNGDLTPADVVAGSTSKVWWQCPQGPDHEWEASPVSRTHDEGVCPCCTNQLLSVTNSLASLFPEIAAEWHPTKNGNLTPVDVVAGSRDKFWWKCPKGRDHEWEAPVSSRTGRQKTRCPCCSNRQVSVTNSLASLFPEIAAEWHPTKNGDLTPADVVAGSNQYFWWKCPLGEDHEWKTAPNNRTGTRKDRCPCCRNIKISVTNSLASLFPEIAAEWHTTKNGNLTPVDVVAGSREKFWWKCPKGRDHEWEAKIADRTGGPKSGCPCCRGLTVSDTNSLASLYPDIAAEWHPTKNGSWQPATVVAGSTRKLWWKCPKGVDHEWEASSANRTGREKTGCPYCNLGWTLNNVRRFVRSLLDQDLLNSLAPAELFLLAQQNGLGTSSLRRSEFVKALTSGRLASHALEQFANADADSELEQLFGDVSAEDLLEGSPIDNHPDDIDIEISDDAIDIHADDSLPEVSAGSILDSLESNLWSTADEEAVEFLVASGISKLWKKAYDPAQLDAVRNAMSTERDGEYSERVRTEFLAELDAAESLPIPDGYNFRINGESILPNLMQRHVAAQVRDRRRVGNWSGTGAGKTLSAVLASRVINAELTIVLCPNAVIHNGWIDTIYNSFPTARIATKTLTPVWPAGDGPRYLILNYETLQQPTSESRLAEFLKTNRVDFVVIDEIHYTKQRTDEASKRRRLTTALCATAVEANPDLAVLGMSATPVINNLREGVSMIELVSGLDHSDLKTTASVDNCMKIHQRLVRLGTRWMPPYPEFARQNPRVDVSHAVDDIRALPKGSSGLLGLEQLLLEAKLDCILEHVEDGTLIYTEYVDGIVLTLTRALAEAGWKVGRYTGEDKTGLVPFLQGKLNVLIGSSSIGTGVDGLQHRARKLIIACAPWTAAAYEQLVGRLVRQGQQQPVEVIFPITFAHVNGEEWSWCQSRLNRLQYKKSIADAAVDGIVPTGHLRSPEQAFQDALGWLKRVEGGEITEIKRTRIVVPLSDKPVDVERRATRYGDFSVMNNRWNSTGSGKLHERLQKDPTEWANYHTLYRDARTTWPVVPFEKIGNWISLLPKNRVIGDFGCGEDLLGQRLRGEGYQVHSFDHVAISDDVVRCDIGEGVPLADSEIDVAVFSLSLMGANSGDYLRDAARTLVFDGRMIICEASSRFPEDHEIRSRLERLGFHVTDINHDAQFTFIQAIRTDREPETGISLV